MQSNAAGHYSAVAYSLRGPALTVCAPIRWDELGSIVGADAFRFDVFASRLKDAGEVFANEVKVIAGQRFGGAESFAHRFQK